MRKILLLALIAVSAHATDVSQRCKETTISESAVITPATSVRLLPYLQDRKCLMIQNKSASGTAYITFQSGGGATEGIALTPGAPLQLSPAPINEIWVRSIAGVTSTVIAVEGQ